MQTKNIKQTILFDFPPEQIYELLMDSKKHADFTESPAHIGKNVGEKFNSYGDYIEGTNVELIPNKKIVQRWRAKDWPIKHFSVVTFELAILGNGTKLSFSHIGVPANQYTEISIGWREHYWQKMKAYLKENN
ncbi:MAG: SRPBCC domain-containing protein [Nanoarchaeota archaeon]